MSTLQILGAMYLGLAGATALHILHVLKAVGRDPKSYIVLLIMSSLCWPVFYVNAFLKGGE